MKPNGHRWKGLLLLSVMLILVAAGVVAEGDEAPPLGNSEGSAKGAWVRLDRR